MYRYKNKTNCLDCKNIARYDTDEDLQILNWIWVDKGWICENCRLERTVKQAVVTYNYLPLGFTQGRRNFAF